MEPTTNPTKPLQTPTDPKTESPIAEGKDTAHTTTKPSTDAGNKPGQAAPHAAPNTAPSADKSGAQAKPGAWTPKVAVDATKGGK